MPANSRWDLIRRLRVKRGGLLGLRLGHYWHLVNVPSHTCVLVTVRELYCWNLYVGKYWT